MTKSHFSFSSVQIFGTDVSTYLIVVKYFRVDDGQTPTAYSQHRLVKMQRPACFADSWCVCITRKSKKCFFPLHYNIFWKALLKGPTNVFQCQPGIKVQDVDEICIFIVISEPWSWWATFSLSSLIFQKVILVSVVFWKHWSCWCLWLFFWWWNWSCMSTWIG